MKKLHLRALYLTSKTERRAKKILFDPQVTVIKGANDTGKSSVLKSIYWCLGAEPAVTNRIWRSLNVMGLLEFSIDGVDYSILRSNNIFAVFDAEGRVLLRTSSVTKELSPFLSPLLNFGLYLTSRDGKSEIPPLAYCFLPFYIDQDAGWQGQWKSFNNLSQYDHWKQSVIPYHSGIKPNEFFAINAALTQEKQKKSELEDELRSMNSALDRMKKRSELNIIDVNQELYKKAIGALLGELTALRSRRLAVSNKIADLSSQKILLDEQIGIARSALAEFDKDYRFIKEQRTNTILCPTCGTEHENSFFHRFSLIEDREACRNFLLATMHKAELLANEIAKANTSLGREDVRIAKINALLEQKRAKLKLRDVIDIEGEKKAREIVLSELNSIESEIAKCKRRLSALERDIAEYDDPHRKKEIEEFYHEKMNAFARDLNLTSEYPQRIDYVIKETGNDRPRALLAYFYAYLHTIHEYSTSCFCPIVIDSPKQQDPDEDNVVAAFKLIFSERPKDAQLVLGTVSLPDIPHGGKTITLTDKYKLLQESEFNEVSSHMRPWLDAIYS